VVPVTNVRDGFEHLVAEAAMTPRTRAVMSHYAGVLCGRRRWPARLARRAQPVSRYARPSQRAGDTAAERTSAGYGLG
jgi:hypothetical protein